MLRQLAAFCLLTGVSGVLASEPPPPDSPLLQKPWYELRSENFRVFSCAPTQEVAKVMDRLEYFRGTYSALAGTQAVASIPIMVMVFPDQRQMGPYLPLYEGAPANVKAMFIRGSDENWIVTCLSGDLRDSFETVYHEYAHLLLRRNDRIWPLWLKEGMAEIYETFQFIGLRGRMGSAKPRQIVLLRREGLMPLEALAAVTTTSPEYNERQRQEQFYAQSWLLAHYLIAGDNRVLRERFPAYTARLRKGEGPLEALTNALGVTSSALLGGLQKYLLRPTLENVELAVTNLITIPDRSPARPLSQTETALRLGSELLRMHQPDKAQQHFLYAKDLAPTNPLPFEGLGLLAATRKDWAAARKNLERAMELKSDAFLTYFLYGVARVSAASRKDQNAKLDSEAAAEIRGALERSAELMPTFGPAHHLLGVFEAKQGDMPKAELHLRKALELEPDNAACAVVLAHIQMERSDWVAARETLLPALHPSVDENIRNAARELMRGIAEEKRPKTLAGRAGNAQPKRQTHDHLRPYKWGVAGVLLGLLFIVIRRKYRG